MANHFSANYDVINVCADDKKGEPFYKLNDSVKFYNLLDTKVKTPFSVKVRSEFCKILSKVGLWDKPLSRNIYKENELTRRLKKVLECEKPDVIICYSAENLRIIYQLGFSLKKVIVMFHNPPILDEYSGEAVCLLKKVGKIQVLTRRFKYMLESAGYSNVICIGNVIKGVKCLSNNYKQNKKIICVARLDKNQKRQHLLIEAFGKIANKFPDWTLNFYGGNSVPVEYKKELENLISCKNLQQQVFLRGISDKIVDVMKSGSFFVLPSSYEGFGIDLGEAMSAGLPCIGFKSCPAVNELIVNEYNGYLCDDNIESLALTIEKMIVNEDKRIAMGKNAFISVRQYSPDNIYSKWEVLIDEVAVMN